jgi:hypothetical protein
VTWTHSVCTDREGGPPVTARSRLAHGALRTYRLPGVGSAIGSAAGLPYEQSLGERRRCWTDGHPHAAEDDVVGAGERSQYPPVRDAASSKTVKNRRALTSYEPRTRCERLAKQTIRLIPLGKSRPG